MKAIPIKIKNFTRTTTLLDQTPSYHKGILWVYLNGRCNFTCDYCLDGRNSLSGTLDEHPEYLAKLIQLQKDLGFTLVLTGGEPLLSLSTVKNIFNTFNNVPKTIQTNGALTKHVLEIIPLFQPNDWFSISYHQESLDHPNKKKAIEKSIQHLLENNVKVFIQYMCSPENIECMLKQAEQHAKLGCKVSMRRLFEYPSENFLKYQELVSSISTEFWAEDAFFLKEAEFTQPFKAAVIYLDGTIKMVCREEVEIGNLFTGYDLSIIEPHRKKACDSVCHCCSCLWVNSPWGFA